MYILYIHVHFVIFIKVNPSNPDNQQIFDDFWPDTINVE